MFELEYDQSPFTGFCYGEGTVPACALVHRVERVDKCTIRKQVFRRVHGEPSFTAIVRAFEGSGLFNVFWDYRVVGARLTINYKLCARFFGVNQNMF